MEDRHGSPHFHRSGTRPPPKSVPRRRSLACCVLLVGASCGAFAQQHDSYPERPVRVVVPLAPGGATDILARVLCDHLSRSLGKQFVVDNRGGAGGTIAYALVSKARADGYTLLAVASDFAMTPALYPNLGYDAQRSFTPLSLVSESPFLLVVHPALAVASVADLIDMAKAKPGALNFASGGQGSSLHVVLELFKLAARVDMSHVPYRSGGQALGSAVSGEVQGAFANSVSALPHVRSGRLRAIAVTSAQRASVLPQVPTVAESGIPGFEATAWHAWLAPAATPAAIVTRIGAELAKIVRSPEIANRLAADGSRPIGSNADELARHLSSELAKFARVIKDGGIRIE